MSFTPYTEANFQAEQRKRVPLRDAFIEAYPEETPILTIIKKETGKSTTSPDTNTSEVEWPWKNFRKGRNRPTRDGVDLQSNEYENNDVNLFNVKGRIQLNRVGTAIGRIAEAVYVPQYGNPGGKAKQKFLQNKKDALRGLRADKEYALASNTDTRPQGTAPAAHAYWNAGFGAWANKQNSPDLALNAAVAMPTNSIVKLNGGVPSLTPDTIVANFAEANVRSMGKSVWDARKTKANLKFFLTSSLQDVIDEFLVYGPDSVPQEPIRRFNQDASDRKISLSVKSYEGSFVNATFIPKHDLPIALTDSVTTTSSSKAVTVADNTIYSPGMVISGTGIPANSYVDVVPDPATSTTTIYLNANATGSATVTATVDTNVYAEGWDFDFVEMGYIDEVGWVDLENKGGGPRGYADALWFLANLNPQAHAIVTD